MKLDIVFVTYNSCKWIDKCLESICNNKYNLKEISLLFCDNNSSDDTVKKLEYFASEYREVFNTIKIVKSNKNNGFGKGNNLACKQGNGDFVFFLNIDTEIKEDTLSKIEEAISKSNKKIGAWELAQAPYEHPKYYDPITGEVSWASGACLIIKRTLFEKINGFDTGIFMYAEDVEISWHIRRKGFKIKYLPNIEITHYSYTEPNEFKKVQYINGIVNNLYLRYKYGNLKNMIKGNLIVGKRFLKNYLVIDGVCDEQTDLIIRKEIKKRYFKMFLTALKLIPINLASRRFNGFKPQFKEFDYETNKLDPFYVKKNQKTEGPLVSIIVRTCGRPSILKETLISLRKQSYKNIEVVIIEDGPNDSENMIKNEFSDLNILYHAFGKNQGRSKAGNYGMKISHGKYLNFLDDDDLFYNDHVQILVNELENSNYKIAYSTAFETPIIIHSKNPYRYDIKFVKVVHFGRFNELKLLLHNITPIQAVMFEKEVFENCGGFDESIDALEDWDLWLRFSFKYNFKYIAKTTSIYRVPHLTKVSKEREDFLNSTLKYVVRKNSSTMVKANMIDAFEAINGELIDE